MGQWKKTSCVLCGNQCGLEVDIENNTILLFSDSSIIYTNGQIIWYQA